MKLDLDVEQFWKDEELAHQDRCFSEQAPQVAMGIRMSDECVFAELGEEGNPWGYTPRERRMELNKRYNDKAEKIVGRRLLSEWVPPEEERFPAVRQIGQVFGGQYVFDGNTTWLKGSCSTPKELETVLDSVDKMDLREFILPANWDSEKKRLFEAYGKKPGLFSGIRGPVTLATSIYGAENLIFLIYDEPDLAARFRDTIAKTILGYINIFIEEAGYTKEEFPHGFSFYDDDCNLLSPEMYQFLGYPILKEVFAFTSPNPGDRRYQHSDSAMEHIVPLLSGLDLTGTNFGPTVPVDYIRKHLPHACIDGQLAPFTFMRNDEDAIIAEVKRDCERIKSTGTRGLNIYTAGSINNGSLLTSMRAVMAAVQNYGRY